MKDFKLEGNWLWDGSWEVFKNSNTDPEGWQYAKSFKSTFKKQNETFDTVRKRQWIRKCYQLI